MWPNDADDRAFLREICYEVIAVVAPEELDEFEQLFGSFAAPHPHWSHRAYCPSPQQSRLTPVVPAVICSALNLLLCEIQSVAQYDRVEIIKLALKRIFRQASPHPSERAELRESYIIDDPRLSLVAFLYTRPVVIEVPLKRMSDVAYRAAAAYGLDRTRADELVPLTLARLILGSRAFRESD